MNIPNVKQLSWRAGRKTVEFEKSPRRERSALIKIPLFPFDRRATERRNKWNEKNNFFLLSRNGFSLTQLLWVTLLNLWRRLRSVWFPQLTALQPRQTATVWKSWRCLPEAPRMRSFLQPAGQSESGIPDYWWGNFKPGRFDPTSGTVLEQPVFTDHSVYFFSFLSLSLTLRIYLFLFFISIFNYLFMNFQKLFMSMRFKN